MFTKISIVAACVLIFSSAPAEDNTLKEGAKEVGHATGNAVHQVGQGAKKVGKEVAQAAREVGHATRDGAKEFTKAVKGETDEKTPAANQDSKPAAPSSAASHIDK